MQGGRGGGDLCVQEARCTAGLGVTTPLPTSAPHLLCEALPHQSHGKQSPLHALAVRPWRSHLTSLNCGFLPYKMGTVALPLPSLQFLPKSVLDLKELCKPEGSCTGRDVLEALEKQECLAPWSVLIQTRQAFPRQGWSSSSHLSVSQSPGTGIRETGPAVAGTPCQTLQKARRLPSLQQ